MGGDPHAMYCTMHRPPRRQLAQGYTRATSIHAAQWQSEWQMLAARPQTRAPVVPTATWVAPPTPPMAVEATYNNSKGPLTKMLKANEAREQAVRQTQDIMASKGQIAPEHPADMPGPKALAAMKKPAFHRECNGYKGPGGDMRFGPLWNDYG